MKKSMFTEQQILTVLMQGDAGTPLGELCRKNGISTTTYYT